MTGTDLNEAWILDEAARIVWRRTVRKTFTVRVMCRVLERLAEKIRNERTTHVT